MPTKKRTQQLYQALYEALKKHNTQTVVELTEQIENFDADFVYQLSSHTKMSFLNLSAYDAQLFQFFIDKGCTLLDYTPEDKSVLMSVLPHSYQIVEYVAKNTNILNFKRAQGTALHEACTSVEDNFDKIDLLIRCGINPYAEDSTGGTALDAAVRHSKFNNARHLVVRHQFLLTDEARVGFEAKEKVFADQLSISKEFLSIAESQRQKLILSEAVPQGVKSETFKL